MLKRPWLYFIFLLIGCVINVVSWFKFAGESNGLGFFVSAFAFVSVWLGAMGMYLFKGNISFLTIENLVLNSEIFIFSAIPERTEYSSVCYLHCKEGKDEHGNGREFFLLCDGWGSDIGVDYSRFKKYQAGKYFGIVARVIETEDGLELEVLSRED